MDFKLFILNVCVLLWTFRVQYISSADCNTVFQGLPTFQNCAYRCHCKNDAQCDEQTGSCDNGCEFGWMGPACQYRNIAQFYTRAHTVGGTSISNDWATKAVDGDVTTCARTSTAGVASSYRSYWRIEWEKEYRIVGLVIKVPQDEVDDFNKFRVETGTGTNNDDFNNICYQHDDIPGTPEMEIMCRKPVWTKHLRIILDKQNTRLRVCEVEIYGGRDLTFNRPTSQSSTFTDPHTNWAWVSSRAVDGRRDTSDINAADTCSATNYETRQYWNVDFLTEYVVQSIFFYGRLEAYEQYRYFRISLINADKTETVLLYEDLGNTDYRSYQPKHVDLTTVATGRYLYVDRQLSNIALLTICEIIAFGECPLGKCGWNCTVDCHCAAEITGTFQKDGKCPNGCSGRWTGVNKTCTLECTTTEWGNQCQNECGNCHQGEACDVVTGHCENGCSGPLYRPDCTQACTNHTYGINCEHTCGQCKDNQQCDIHSGDCDQGCVIGKQPPLCQEACSSGTYGDGCTSQCGNCLHGFTCHPETGVCEYGCLPGYSKPFCNNTCDSGWWGVNCAHKCGNCKNGMACNGTNGICNDGCQAGWGTAYCNEPCASGIYGEGCDQLCGKCFNNEVCNSASGRCPNGCQAGFEGAVCKSACAPGSYYGEGCANKCGHCLQGATCNPETGVCETGCDPWFLHPFCNESVNVLYNLRDNITVTISSVLNDMNPEYATNNWYGTRDPETCKCCSITTYAQISWWKVDLQNIYPLKEMHVYASENDRSSIQLSGFSVYLANNSKEEAKLVFSDTSNINEDNDHFVIQLSNRLGRIVTIQRFGTLAVCNVSLIQGECSTGYFGPHCADVCHCADGAPCNRNNGNCQSPICKLGWTGPACNTECPIYRFGEGCKNECFCKEGTCTKDYGICNGVCQAGYRGAQCNEACPFGTFGESCTEMCHCQNSTCSADDGLCPGDCIDGYEGQKCNKKSIGKDNTKAIGIGVGVGAFVLIVILIVVIYRYRIYKREQYIKENYASTDNRNASPEEQVYDSIDTDIGTNEARLGETNM